MDRRPYRRGSKSRASVASVIGWTLAAAVVVVWLTAILSLSVPAVVCATGALVVTLAMIASRVFPGCNARARRLLPVLWLLVVPWLASIAFGPRGHLASPPTASGLGNALFVQDGLLAISVILPFAMAPMMRGGRRFTATVGLLNACVTLVVVGASDLILAPGS